METKNTVIPGTLMVVIHGAQKPKNKVNVIKTVVIRVTAS